MLDTEQLKSIHSNDFLNRLFEMESLSYVHSRGCLVCNTDVFVYKRGVRDYDVLFHRGTQLTYVRTSMYGIINDIIVFPNGTVRLDWNENAPALIDYETDADKNEDTDASLVSLKKTDMWNAFEKTVGKERTEKGIEKAFCEGFQNTVKQNQNDFKYDGWSDMIRIANINRIFKKSRESEDTYSCGGVSIRRSSC